MLRWGVARYEFLLKRKGTRRSRRELKAQVGLRDLLRTPMLKHTEGKEVVSQPKLVRTDYGDEVAHACGFRALHRRGLHSKMISAAGRAC